MKNTDIAQAISSFSQASLKKTTTADRSGVIQSNASPEVAGEEDQRRKYFFDTGVGVAFSNADAESFTFRSTNVEINREEARIICDCWVNRLKARQTTSNAVSPPEIPATLSRLTKSIAAGISKYAQHGAFVKLTTRSPKDSNLVFALAEQRFQQLEKERQHAKSNQQTSVADIDGECNRKMALLSRCVTEAQRVTNGEEAMQRLMDSERVFEDLNYALEDQENWTVAITCREWNRDVTIESEFRGFVWGGQLNALGQYFHPLHFGALPAMQAQIAADCRHFFSKISSHISIQNYIVDFAWLGPGNVILVEVNPFDGVLGSFPCSTGLFTWESDRKTITEGPFEMRVREKPIEAHKLKFQIGKEWRRVVFGC